MTVAVTQVGSGTTGADPSNGSVTVNKPTGVASGDVLLVFGASNEGAWDTLPSGFTQIDLSTDANTPNNFRCYAWYKVCGGSEPASYTFGSTTAAGSGAPMVVNMTAWRGVSNSSPIMHNARTDAGAVTEAYTPAASFTQSATGRVVFARCARAGTTFPAFSTAAGGWSELADAGAFSGGTISYGVATYGKTADTSSGSQTCPATTCSQTETDNVSFLVALRAAMNADTVSAAVTAYDVASLTISTTAAVAGATATAYDATVLTGVATSAGSAGAVVTAYNAAGWVIHPVNVGVQAFDASVAITTSAEYAQASVAIGGAHAYFGAPESRRWRIPPEDRSWRVQPESRAWTIPPEDRTWKIAPEDN